MPKAKLAQKLRWRKATESNFCDKVFIGFENHVIRYFLQILQIYIFIFTTFQILFLYWKNIFLSGVKPRTTATLLCPKVQFHFEKSGLNRFFKIFQILLFGRRNFSAVKKIQIQPLLRPCPKVRLIFSSSTDSMKKYSYPRLLKYFCISNR